MGSKMASSLTRRGVTYARANWGRWVADCSAPFCHSALQLAPEQAWFSCRECETVAEIVWPQMVGDIERLLMMRPDEVTRNWEPGETLFDLIEQNNAHGILPWDLATLKAKGQASIVLGRDCIHELTTGGR